MCYNNRLITIIVRNRSSCHLEDFEILAVFHFRVFLAKHPGEHLPGFEAGFYEVSVFVPMVVLLVAVGPLQPDLIENSHQQFVHVVIDTHGYFDILGPVRARQVSTLCGRSGNNSKHKSYFNNVTISVSHV